MIVGVLFASIIDVMVVKTNGRISRKMTYMPLSFGSIIGSPITSIGATCLITASAMLADSYYGRSMTLFEPLKVSLPGIVISILFYLTIGYELQQKWFDFPSPMPEINETPQTVTHSKLTWRMWFVLAVAIGCIICFMAGLNMGAVALSGACILILSGCITAREAFRGVNWQMVFTVGASLGFAQGIGQSGAAQILTDVIFKVAGPLGESPFGMCVAIFAVAIMLSIFMSNNATVVVMLPIALLLAQSLNADAMAFALACAIGAEIAIAMPICSVAVTYTISAGYRTKDYVRLGGILTLLMFIADSIALWYWFFR